MASWEFAIPAQSIWLWSAEMGLRWSNALGIVNSKIIWVLLLNAWLVSPLFEIFLKWSMPRKVSTRLMVSMKVSPSMLGYWNFWKLSEFGRKSNLTSVFVGMYNVHVETTSGPDMCASFSRFYSFNLSTFSKDTRLLKLHGSFTNRCSMKRKVVNSPGCGSSLIPGWKEEDGDLWSWWNHWVLIDLKIKIRIIVWKEVSFKSYLSGETCLWQC